MPALPRLKVSDNKRFLAREDGAPFFWLADTAWELFHKLNKEEAELYLKNRAELGFNVVQAVALAEFEGLTIGNAYGRRPLKAVKGIYDPSQPDVSPEPGGYSYWDHVDFIVRTAEAFGIYLALLPTWGDKYNQAWGKGPEIFDAHNAEAYGRWLGERYRDQANIVWVLGGDRALVKRRHFEVITAMAAGLKAGDGGRHLITFHPMGGHSSSHHHVKALIESRPYEERVPDQSLIAENYEGSNYMAATRGSTYAMVFSPYGLPVKVVMGKIEGAEISASWYDPRTGAAQCAGVYVNSGETVFMPPSAGRGNDWILVLDSH